MEVVRCLADVGHGVGEGVDEVGNLQVACGAIEKVKAVAQAEEGDGPVAVYFISDDSAEDIALRHAYTVAGWIG